MMKKLIGICMLLVGVCFFLNSTAWCFDVVGPDLLGPIDGNIDTNNGNSDVDTNNATSASDASSPGLSLASALSSDNDRVGLTQSVTYGNETINLLMTKETVRGENFEVLVQNDSGTYDTHAAGEVQTYIGIVKEYPGAIAAGIIKANGVFWGQVYFDRGLTWKIMGNSVYATKGHVEPTITYPSTKTVSEGDAGIDTYLFDVGIDLDYRYYIQRDGVADCLEAVEFTISQIKALYLRDALLMPALGRVIIRASQEHCPYDGTFETLSLLNLVKAEWNENHTDADRDLVALASRNIDEGRSYLGTVGGAYGYSVNNSQINGAFDSYLQHEMGHNWGASDNQADDPEGKTIMCGNQYGRFAGPSLKKIFTERDEKIHLLDNMGIYSSINLAPYAALDAVYVLAIAGSSWDKQPIIYPLANDHDVNGDSISLVSWDTVSEEGGSIELSESQNNGLIYTPPGNCSSGQTDSFYYTIEDSDAKTATGIVVVTIRKISMDDF
ncbi:MAG: hypothetical protein GY874_23785 [Desulfobacteraceae bacterium]|nr:hypothetical protein [Desulfobacteraceae bacterium]